VFDAIIDGWKAQMMARGLATQTIEGRCRVLRRFQEYAGTFPWTWRPVDLDDYMAERRSGEKPISLTTLRSDSDAIAMFCAYTSSPTYGWGESCEQTFGDVPAQIAFDWNTPRHTTDDAVPPPWTSPCANSLPRPATASPRPTRTATGCSAATPPVGTSTGPACGAGSRRSSALELLG